MTGVRAEVRAGYQTAARLGAWTMSVTPAGWHCMAEIIEVHPFWLAHGGALNLIISAGQNLMQWPVQSWQMQDNRLILDGVRRGGRE